MSQRDHKLPPEHDDDASADAAQQLDAHDQREAEALREALFSALHPRALDDDLNEALIARALSRMPSAPAELRPEPPASKAEAREAALLRAALEGAAEDHPLAELALAARLAHAPRGLDDLSNERLLRPALRTATRGTVRRTLTVAIFAAVAVAAGVVGLSIERPTPTSAPRAQIEQPAQLGVVDESALLESRSTTDLFQAEDFPKTGGVTQRIDRITESRNADLRENRFVSWGVP